MDGWQNLHFFLARFHLDSSTEQKLYFATYTILWGVKVEICENWTPHVIFCLPELFWYCDTVNRNKYIMKYVYLYKQT